MSAIRYAGVWNVSITYFFNNMVVSPLDDKAYLLTLSSLTGGTDPSVPSADWELAPNGGGGGGGVTTLNTKTGAVELQSTDDLFIYDNTDPQIILFTRDADSYGVYTEATGGSAAVDIVITKLTANGVVSICYVHAGGGGGSQYTKAITNSSAFGIGHCSLVFNTNVDIGDQIIWQVLNYGT